MNIFPVQNKKKGPQRTTLLTTTTGIRITAPPRAPLSSSIQTLQLLSHRLSLSLSKAHIEFSLTSLSFVQSRSAQITTSCITAKPKVRFELLFSLSPSSDEG